MKEKDKVYRRKSEGWLKHIDFIILDWISMYIALFLSFLIKFKNVKVLSENEWLTFAGMITASGLFVSVVFNSYSNIMKRNKYMEFAETVKHVACVTACLLGFMFVARNTEAYSRIAISLWVIIYFFIAYFTRVIRKISIRKGVRAGSMKSIMIITAYEDAAKAIRKVKSQNYDRYEITGIILVGADKTGESISGIPVVANEKNAVEYICGQWVDEVVIALPYGQKCSDEVISGLYSMGIVVHIALIQSPLEDGMKVSVGRVGAYTVLTSTINSASTIALLIKRCMDIVGGIIGCIFTLLICVIIGPAIYISDPGPIFFAQTRIGRNGKKFKIYKFRSMYIDAEERKKELMSQNKMNGLMFKMDWDPRIIGCKELPDGKHKRGIGNWIRDLSLDEFPQFFNVLMGDMSLVGTRPPTENEYEQYEAWHKARLAAKPGITGMWQVSGRSNITDFEDVVKLDVKYINEWSIWLDIKILLKTIKVVLLRNGAS